MSKCIFVSYNVFYVQFSLFSVSGPICATTILLFGFFLIDSYEKLIVAVVQFSMLKGDRNNSENFTPVNNIQYTVFDLDST